MENRINFLLIACLGFCWACQESPPMPPDKAEPIYQGGVFVLNEGNFQANNASLDWYDHRADSLGSQVFKQVNGFALGDVFQSMSAFNSKYYLVVNNSRRIEVVNPATLKSETSIVGLNSPRYFLGLSDQKAYVSDLYANAVQVVDIFQNQVVGGIPLPGWTEAMVFLEQWVFVSNMQRPYLYMINPQTDALFDSIAVGLGGNSLKIDQNQHLWLLCEGDILTGSAGSLHRIDPLSREVLSTYTFEENQHPNSLQLNPAGDTLYYLLNGVQAMSIQAQTLPTDTHIPENGSLFYGLGVHPNRGTLYVSDAIDFVQRGLIFRYSPTGAELGSFRAGIIPGDFFFQ